MNSKSLWYVAPEKLEIRDVAIPDPGCGEVLVRIDACGVCAWDLFIFSGGFQSHVAYPFCFGHEGIGTISRAGAGASHFKEGDRIALRESPVIGKPGSGHMAEYAVQPEAGLIPLPQDGKPAEQWMIEPAACCVNSINMAGIKPGFKVALVGCGFMGSILLQLLLQTAAADIAVFEIRPQPLSYARSLASSRSVRVLHSNDIPDHDEALDGKYDVVIEAAATEPAFGLANRLVRVGGTLVVFSWHHNAFPVDLGEWHGKGLRVLNTSPKAEPHFTDCFLQAVPLLEQGQIDLRQLVTHVAPPEEAQSLFETGMAKRDAYIKGVIRWAPV